MGMFKKPKGRIPWVVYCLTLIQTAIFIAEIVKNASLTGSPIEIHPSFNPMIGPSPWILINMGARYMPCMHNVVGIQDRTSPIVWGCPNTTSTDVNDCTLSDLCGFSGVPNPLYDGNINQSPQPDQWFRFIIPMFLHAGIIHIGFNMLLQMTLGREMEIAIGSIRFFLVYISSGIFGFVLGGNFAAAGIASTGASGSLFGILALTLLDLLYTWKERLGPWKDFAFIMLDVVISLVLGLLPGLDNFSHIGGFLMGLVLGICILHSPNALRKRINQDEPYIPVSQIKASDGDGVNAGMTGFIKNPVGFFQKRRPAWWAWWLIRAGALAGVFIVFILLLNNFYIYRKTCSWCKYLSCLNINHWCDIGNLELTNADSSGNGTSKRDLFDGWSGWSGDPITEIIF
jgi:membrane associated rhomboid family serine protease